jgi:predicted nucleic-acid-binding protein
MIALDTNVLLRLLLEDDAAQAAKARQLINRETTANRRIYLSTVVVCELVWVLRSRYRIDRQAIAVTLEQLTSDPNFELQERSILYLAMVEYRSGKGDFSDYVIGQTARFAGCSSTATFDEALAVPLFTCM